MTIRIPITLETLCRAKLSAAGRKHVTGHRQAEFDQPITLRRVLAAVDLHTDEHCEFEPFSTIELLLPAETEISEDTPSITLGSLLQQPITQKN